MSEIDKGLVDEVAEKGKLPVSLRGDISPGTVTTLLIFYALALVVCPAAIVILVWSLPSEDRRSFALLGMLFLAALITLVTAMAIRQYKKLTGIDERLEKIENITEQTRLSQERLEDELRRRGNMTMPCATGLPPNVRAKMSGEAK